MKATVLVPTWRRPDDLARCLDGLAAQTRLPDEVVVTARADDHETWRALRGRTAGEPTPRAIRVNAPGVVASLNAGLRAASGELIAIIDDDAVARPDWLERIERHLREDTGLGAVGGRDWMHEARGYRTVGDSSLRGALIGALERLLPGTISARAGHLEHLLETPDQVVGKVHWFGRLVGNHHLDVTMPREVDVLKGANMAVRREALAGLELEEGLRGSGMQMHWELQLCMALKRAGWRLLYDPAIAVDHHPAARFDEDQRVGRPLVALQNEVYNQTFTLLRGLDWPRKLTSLVYGLAVGTRHAPGLVTGLEQTLRGRRRPGAFVACTRVRLQAARDAMRGRPSGRGGRGAQSIA